MGMMMGVMRKENSGSIKRIVWSKRIKRSSEDIHGFFLYGVKR
jgi:hypothetical protein